MLFKIFLYVTLFIKLTISIDFVLAQEEYFPLQVGNQWTYNYYSEDKNHNTIDTMYTISVIDTTNGYYLFDRYFYYLSSFNNGDSSLFMIKEHKIIRNVNDIDMTWYNFSANVGDTWNIPIREFLFQDTIDVIAELKSKTDTYILGKDTLKNCYRFLFQFTEMIPDIFPWEELFAPDIGLVKSESGSIFWEYHSFTFKKGIINGQQVSVSQSDNENLLPCNFFLRQNYPNPFNSTTKIEYGITARIFTKISLKVYNVRGQEIKILINKSQPPGMYELIWDGKDDVGNNVPSGIYLYCLTVGRYQIFKKLILLK